jgi:hypothetical protein
MIKPIASFLVLDFKKFEETKLCLQSIRDNARFSNQIIYLDNGSNEDYPFEIYKQGLCDVLISKKVGNGGGTGQTDLFRYCDTKFCFFVQNDQILSRIIDQEIFDGLVNYLDNGYDCVDLNGDQSGRKAWTDRAHLIKTDFFNKLGPFPNGGPGNDAAPWNEKYIQDTFEKNNYKIAHLWPTFFSDNGKWSIREAGDGIYKHRCDQKGLFVLQKPTYKTDIYPPLNDLEWDKMLSGAWKDGDIPEQWKPHSFRHWKD